VKELSQKPNQNQKFPIISFMRKVIQIASFVVINYVMLELIFKIDLSVFSQTIKVFPFLQSSRDAWSTGAGLMEYIFYALGHGEIPFLLIGMFFLIILFTGRWFCGWVCPTGFIQDLLSILPKQEKRMSISADKSLKKVKGWLFVIILIIIFALGVVKNIDFTLYVDFNLALGDFIRDPIAGFSLAEFVFRTIPTLVQSVISTMSFEAFFSNGWVIASFIFYIVVIGLCIYYPRFYCRVICPYGAASAYISDYAFLKYSRNPVKCTGRRECGLCEKVCPVQIRILDEPFEAFTGNGECNLCSRCKESCPHDAIKLTFG
jgi:ferredoxin-type protein NapH